MANCPGCGVHITGASLEAAIEAGVPSAKCDNCLNKEKGEVE